MDNKSLRIVLTVIALVIVVALIVTYVMTNNANHGQTQVASAGDNMSSQNRSGTTEQNVPSGDIPDNAVFLTYANASDGYSLQYIEGWVVSDKPRGGISIQDKDSVESVEIRTMPAVDMQTYVHQVDTSVLQANITGFSVTGIGTASQNGNTVVKLSYTGLSSPDPVTGKQRTIISDRYYLPGPGNRFAILTLSTPQGVDNVDAFNQILASFRWN